MLSPPPPALPTPCPSCDGTGRSYGNGPCRVCDGRGYPLCATCRDPATRTEAGDECVAMCEACGADSDREYQREYAAWVAAGRPVGITCHGCDEYRFTRGYVVTHHDGASERVRYCEDCAALARTDWNGEAAAIREAA